MQGFERGVGGPWWDLRVAWGERVRGKEIENLWGLNKNNLPYNDIVAG